MQSALTAFSSTSVRRRLDESAYSAFISKVASVIDSYGLAVASKWLGAGKRESSVLFSKFKVHSTVVSSTDDAFLQIPLSDEEVLSGAEAHSVSMLTEDIDSGEIRIVSTELKGGAAAVNAHSSLIRVTAEAANVTKQFRFVLQHSRRTEFPIFPANTTFRTSCDEGDQSAYEHICPQGGYVILHQCNGSASVLTSLCPGTRMVSACRAASEELQSSCHVESFTDSNTTCVCLMRPFDTSSGRRRLDDALAESGYLEIAAISTETSLQFAGTLYESRNINSVDDFKQALIVIIMYSVMWGLGLFVSWYLSLSNDSDDRTDQINKLLHGTKLNAIAQTTDSFDKIKKYLNAYVDEIFPAVYNPKPWYNRLIGEIFKHHRFICIFVVGGERKSRFVTTIHLLTIQTMLMFMLAVFYDVQVHFSSVM